MSDDSASSAVDLDTPTEVSAPPKRRLRWLWWAVPALVAVGVGAGFGIPAWVHAQEIANAVARVEQTLSEDDYNVAESAIAYLAKVDPHNGGIESYRTTLASLQAFVTCAGANDTGAFGDAIAACREVVEGDAARYERAQALIEDIIVAFRGATDTAVSAAEGSANYADALAAIDAFLASVPDDAAAVATRDRLTTARAATMSAALSGFARSEDPADATVSYSWTGVSGGFGIAVSVEKNHDESETDAILLVTKFNKGSCIAPVRLSVAADGVVRDYELGLGATDCPLEGYSFPDYVSMAIAPDSATVIPLADYRQIARASAVKFTYVGVVGDVETFTLSPEFLAALRNSLAGAGW